MDIPEVPNTHFTELVRNGSLLGASSGAKAARALADAITNHAMRLDERAFHGMLAFADFAREYPSTARDWFEEDE